MLRRKPAAKSAPDRELLPVSREGKKEGEDDDWEVVGHKDATPTSAVASPPPPPPPPPPPLVLAITPSAPAAPSAPDDPLFDLARQESLDAFALLSPFARATPIPSTPPHVPMGAVPGGPTPSTPSTPSPSAPAPAPAPLPAWDPFTAVAPAPFVPQPAPAPFPVFATPSPPSYPVSPSAFPLFPTPSPSPSPSPSPTPVSPPSLPRASSLDCLDLIFADEARLCAGSGAGSGRSGTAASALAPAPSASHTPTPTPVTVTPSRTHIPTVAAMPIGYAVRRVPAEACFVCGRMQPEQEESKRAAHVSECFATKERQMAEDSRLAREMAAGTAAPGGAGRTPTPTPSPTPTPVSPSTRTPTPTPAKVETPRIPSSTCSHCRQIFTVPSLYTQHLTTVCPMCNKCGYASATALAAHVNRCMDGRPDPPEATPSPPTPPRPTPTPTPAPTPTPTRAYVPPSEDYACPLCGDEYTRAEIEPHTATCSGRKTPRRCTMCARMLARGPEWSRHVATCRGGGIFSGLFT